MKRPIEPWCFSVEGVFLGSSGKAFSEGVAWQAAFVLMRCGE